MEELSQKTDAIISGMLRKGLNFIAIDFDLTLISLHAGGEDWRGSVQDLQAAVRPFFRLFVPRAIQAGLFLAIVTFSKRIKEIEDTLAGVFGDDVAMEIVIRGNDPKWNYVGTGSRSGKQTHMASAASAIKERNPNKENLNITRRSTLLLDDFAPNVEAALSNGVCAIQFIPTDEETTVNNMLHLFPYPPVANTVA